MKKIVLIWCIIIQILTISFQLRTSRETCFIIRQAGSYEFQYTISGQNPQLYLCNISSPSSHIQTLTSDTQFQKTLSFVQPLSRICFSSLDTSLKQVSFDIISTDDPLLGHFQVKEQQTLHIGMFKTFGWLERVYRDQHMFLERAVVYANKIANRQVTIVFVLVFKILVAIILGAYQLLVVKELVAQKTSNYQLPTEIQEQDRQETKKLLKKRTHPNEYFQ